MLGQSATNTEPVSLRPTDRTKSPAGSLDHVDLAPHEDIIACDCVIDETPETPRHPPGDVGEPQGRY